MVTLTHLARIELWGGDLALDFANTLEGTRAVPGTEHLADPGDLAAWAARAGAIPVAVAERLQRRTQADPFPAAALAAARDLRAVVFDVFDALARGAPPPPPALAALRDAAADALARATVRAAPAGLSWRDEPAERPLWPVAVAALDLLRDGERLSRLKACAQCRGLFLDQSRNRSRRWCLMGGCGAQVKMRRYRARRER